MLKQGRSIGAKASTTTGSSSGTRRLVRAPRVEAMDGRRPRDLFERRHAIAREEARFGCFIRSDTQITGGDVRAIDHDKDREAGSHPRGKKAIELDREAGLLGGL